MKFVVTIGIISIIINIISYSIQKREVNGIKFKFKQIRNIYRDFKDKEK
ncbi:hypothetical protein [Tissierella sp. Yu-01]|nr:hypothetical protein [Tissierella sp. Yu-01]WFA08558.1 hypothetical protein P3962_12630 [Tissierella sp. Yu-01]